MTVYCENRLKGDDKNVVSVNIPHPDVKKKKLLFETCSAQYLFLLALLVLSLATSLTTLFICLIKFQLIDLNQTYIATTDGQLSIQKTIQQNTSMFVQKPLGQNLTHANPKSLTIVTRQAWLAQPPSQEATRLHLPVSYIIIMHTATGNCSTSSSCSLIVNAIQSFHIVNRGWNDIGYNFLVGGDGSTYEGRGWETQGAHTYGYNSKSIGIALIGNFNTIMPTERQILGAKALIQMGIEAGYVDSNYKLFAARQLQATQSPGLMLYEDVQKWPHWTKNEKSANN